MSRGKLEKKNTCASAQGIAARILKEFLRTTPKEMLKQKSVVEVTKGNPRWNSQRNC